MTLEERYTRLLEKQQDKDLIPFLQTLTPQERKTLAPHLKKLGKEYLSFRQDGHRWKYKATDKQRTMLSHSFFACYNFTEIQKENPAWLLSREHLEKFLSWYCPPWFNDYINSFTEKNWLPFELDYGYLVELTQRGFVQPNPQLIARLLINFLYEYKERQSYYAPERLLLYPVALQEHIWHIFEHETTVHFHSVLANYQGKQIAGSWLDAFLHYAACEKIDRQRLLQQALLAANRNFNKLLSGWFTDLFTKLAPSAAELLSLQPELFNLFSSPHGKVVTAALQSCKTIADETRFDAEDLLDQVPLLLSSTTKSVVNAALQLLEKLARKKSGLHNRIGLLATGALMHKEESLQVRAAKLIAKFGDPEDSALRDAISPHHLSLFSGARTLLQSCIGQQEEALPAVTADVSKGPLTDGTALPSIGNPDELVFLAAQAFDNNQSWHIDALPAALIRLQREIRGEHISKLEPAIQRALKLYFVEWRSNQGNLDLLLASFFLDCCLWLVRQHPWHGHAAGTLYQNYLGKTEENKKVWQEHGANTQFLSGWKPDGARFLCSAYRSLLGTALERWKRGIILPLLCEPTHAPAWIDPVVLIERLAVYQEQHALPDDIDLQIALSRCWLQSTDQAIRLATARLHGETRRLMLFLLDPQEPPAGPFGMETAWMMAALSKSPGTIYPELAALVYSRQPRALYTGQYPYEVVHETFTYNRSVWTNGKYSQEPAVGHKKLVRLDLSARGTKKPVSGFRKFLAKLAGKKEELPSAPPPLLYDYLRSKETWLSIEDRDIRRIYLLTPNNPGPLLSLLVEKGLYDPDFFSETAKRFTVRVLEVLHETWHPQGEMAHLVIAICLICADKIAVSYAVEIWLRGVEESSIDSRLLGTILGKLERIEYAPLKRLTDLLSRSALGVSPAHNRALETMLTALLKELPATPVKGQRKLLEIYLEVLSLNGSSLQDQALKIQLRQWKENTVLGKVLTRTEID